MICIIGGSGFYNFLQLAEENTVNTPFGDINMTSGQINNKKVAFIPRHGENHGIAPHLINYRRNIYAAYMKNAELIITTNAVGSLREEYLPGQFCIPNQVLDFTHDRDFFFEAEPDNYSIDLFSSSHRKELRDIILAMEEPVIDGGTIVVTNGPRFETKAEIDAYRMLGADYVGMTTAPEVFLANQVNIPYVSLGIITNFAAGMQSEITADEVFDLFSRRIERVKKIIREFIKGVN